MTDYTVRVPAADRSTLQGAFTVAVDPAIGSFTPGPMTTGPRQGAQLTTFTGDYIAGTEGAVIENLDIYGRLRIDAPVTVRNVVVRGNGVDAPASIAGIYSTNDDLFGSVLEHIRVDLTGRSSPWIHDIQGSHFTLRYSELLMGHDGIGIVSGAGPTTIEGNWAHDSAVYEWLSGTPNRPSFSNLRTHNDCIQIHRGHAGIRIVGNNLGGLRKKYTPNSGAAGLLSTTGDDFDNTCIMIQQEVDSSVANHLAHVYIGSNWLQGGAASINLGYKNGNDLSDDIVLDANRFRRRITSGGGYYIYKAAAANPSILPNNVYDDDGTPVTITTY